MSNSLNIVRKNSFLLSLTLVRQQLFKILQNCMHLLMLNLIKKTINRVHNLVVVLINTKTYICKTQIFKVFVSLWNKLWENSRISEKKLLRRIMKLPVITLCGVFGIQTEIIFWKWLKLLKVWIIITTHSYIIHKGERQMFNMYT